MELDFGQEAYAKDFDSFMRYYLTVKTGEIPKSKDVYETFKKYVSSEEAFESIDALVADLLAFARYYCAIALGKEPDKALNRAFHDLRALKVDVVHLFC